MGIGTLRAVVIDVADLSIAEQFWSEVTGLHLVASNYAERFSILADPEPPGEEVILQARDGEKPDTANRCHVDVTPGQGIDLAVEQILALGGTLRKTPSIYPRPDRWRTDDRSSIGRSCAIRSATSSAWWPISPVTNPRRSHEPLKREL